MWQATVKYVAVRAVYGSVGRPASVGACAEERKGERDGGLAVWTAVELRTRQSEDDPIQFLCVVWLL